MKLHVWKTSCQIKIRPGNIRDNTSFKSTHRQTCNQSSSTQPFITFQLWECFKIKTLLTHVRLYFCTDFLTLPWKGLKKKGEKSAIQRNNEWENRELITDKQMHYISLSCLITQEAYLVWQCSSKPDAILVL